MHVYARCTYTKSGALCVPEYVFVRPKWHVGSASFSFGANDGGLFMLVCSSFAYTSKIFI